MVSASIFAIILELYLDKEWQQTVLPALQDIGDVSRTANVVKAGYSVESSCMCSITLRNVNHCIGSFVTPLSFFPLLVTNRNFERSDSFSPASRGQSVTVCYITDGWSSRMKLLALALGKRVPSSL